MARKPSEPRSASLANLDRDGDSQPGGSLPERYPLVDLSTGAVFVVVGAETRDDTLATNLARLATAADLDIAGRGDLADLL